ncbi:uncharacterized protein VP01_2857g4 [Puccinia sorghi]|uniref:Uncharacterized protein n=1 Tax=Puccinia sorghi TaxID=27349 RepID=A0A0L6V1Y4_9BASI|nr:uncharacterized protein VP01_2857g4 [Puccinia sorghi]
MEGGTNNQNSKSLHGIWGVFKMLSWMSGKKSTTISRVAQRIHVEELGPCDIYHWMSMPTTDHIMAEVYNRPVFYYGKSWSQKFFPSTTLPNKNPPIFIEELGTDCYPRGNAVEK